MVAMGSVVHLVESGSVGWYKSQSDKYGLVEKVKGVVERNEGDSRSTASSHLLEDGDMLGFYRQAVAGLRVSLERPLWRTGRNKRLAT